MFNGEKIVFFYYDYKDWFNLKLLMCILDDLNVFDVFGLVMGVFEDDDVDLLVLFEFVGLVDEIIIFSY